MQEGYNVRRQVWVWMNWCKLKEDGRLEQHLLKDKPFQINCNSSIHPKKFEPYVCNGQKL